MTTDNFIKKGKEIHGDKYNYSLTKYIGNIIKVKIICPIHGEFEQTPHDHKRGHGCGKCGDIETGKSAVNTSRGWSLRDWKCKINNNPDSSPTLYVIECSNDVERFIKIGITMRSITKRFCNKTLMPYNYKILHEVSGSADEIFNSEIKFKKELKGLNYKPTVYFSGCNECFTLLSEDIINKLLK